MDELMNYIRTARQLKFVDSFYTFIQNLTEVARSQTGVVLVVSVPASEMEMMADDLTDYNRLQKILNRLGKPLVMSEDTEISEIIRRRRLSGSLKLRPQGKIKISKEARETCKEYGNWVQDYRQQLATSFNLDHSTEEFIASYPFHPTVLSVWQRSGRAYPAFSAHAGVAPAGFVGCPLLCC
jgi:hypothetical protein